MKRGLFIIWVFVLISIQNNYGQSEAVSAFEKGDYNTAISIWEEEMLNEKGSYANFVNLGNAYSKINNLGKARLNYERALKIQPNGKEAKNNIQFVMNQLDDEVIPVEPFFLYKWWQSIAFICSSFVWLIINILLLLSLTFLSYEYFLGHRFIMKKKVRNYLFLTLILTGITFALGQSRKHHSIRNDTAVIMKESALRLGANEISESVTTLEAGYKVIILDQIGEWYKISKLDKEQGWIKKENFEII